jgi:hypothetical protein
MDNENTELCIRGNGKTCYNVYLLYKYYKRGYEVWTNFYTSFSSKIIGFQEMIDTLKELRKDGDDRKIVFGVTEMQDLINSVGSEKNQILYVDSFTNQMRKLGADCIYDTQIFKNVNIRLRRHTENIRIPFKYHLDGKQCNYDNCEQKHIIEVYSFKPFRKRYIKRLKAWEVGKLYNTKEMVIDQLIIPVTKKEKSEKKEPEKIEKSFLSMEDY